MLPSTSVPALIYQSVRSLRRLAQQWCSINKGEEDAGIFPLPTAQSTNSKPEDGNPDNAASNLSYGSCSHPNFNTLLTAITVSQKSCITVAKAKNKGILSDEAGWRVTTELTKKQWKRWKVLLQASHTHTHKHTHTHTYIHTCKHKHIHTHTAHMYTCTHAHTVTHTWRHSCTRMHTHVHTHTHTHAHMHILLYTHKDTHIHICIHMHTDMGTHRCAYTCTFTHTHSRNLSISIWFFLTFMSHTKPDYISVTHRITQQSQWLPQRHLKAYDYKISLSAVGNGLVITWWLTTIRAPTMHTHTHIYTHRHTWVHRHTDMQTLTGIHMEIDR